MFEKKFIRNFDYFSLLIVILLIGVGMVALASATGAQNGSYSYIKSQSMWIVISFTAMIVVALIDYNIYGAVTPYLYLILIIPLAILIFFPSLGYTSHNATSWFKFGSQQVQPSELGKIIFILTFGRHIDYFREKEDTSLNKPLSILQLFIHAAIPIILIMKQPDNGTAMVYMVITVVMIFAAGLSWKYIVPFIATAALVVPVFLLVVLPRLPKDNYVVNRFLVFMNPEYDKLGRGYQYNKSQLAIGSGEMWGQGLFKGMQTQSPKGGLPIKESDFIFAVIGEELGFVVTASLVLLFVVLLVRMCYIAANAKNQYGSLIVIGVCGMLAIHVFQNIGMTIGLMPITGIPLPFISYGGSNLLTNMIGIGLLMSVAMRRQKSSLERYTYEV